MANTYRAPSIARPLARQIDRLARRAHAFHRFAHHPLCDRYAGELIMLSPRRRICRGCTLLACGTLLGFAAGACARAPLSLTAALLLLAALPAAFGFTHPAALRARQHKILTRALPGAALGAWLGTLLHAEHGLAAGMALITALGLLVLITIYRVRGPSRLPCVTCPERHSVTPCSGLREIVRAERAFQHRAHQLLDRANANAAR